MSTGLSSEQLDALRAEVYAAAIRAGDEANRVADERTALREDGATGSRLDDLSNKIDRLFAKANGLYDALGLLDNARRSAAQSKVNRNDAAGLPYGAWPCEPLTKEVDR